MRVLLPISILVFTCCIFNATAQEKKNPFKIGFVYGYGKQDTFPFNSTDYHYEQHFYKAQINYTFKEKNKFSFEINVEPSYYKSKHQLLNKYFVTPESGDDYLEKRDEFTKLKTINEYVLGIGIIVRYYIINPLSIYAFASVGPMYMDTETERLADGFAFSDTFSLGLSYKLKSVVLDVRYGIRHVSNANFQKPNSGHNSTNIELGFLFDL